MNTFGNIIISPYFWNIVVRQISISFLVYSMLVPAVLAVAFGSFLYIKTRKLSSFYLLLLSLFFALYAILDLLTWFPNAPIALGTWSFLDIFSVSFFILSYWFLYSFIKDHDLPLWQKVLTGCALLPTLVITARSINIDTFSAPQVSSLENLSVTNYNSILFLTIILLVVIFSIREYVVAIDFVNKKKIALAGAGVTIFLFVFCINLVVSNFIIAIDLWGLGSNAYVYTIDLYSLFGMPILLGLLGYLIAKYQAFDIRLIKSIVLMVVLMAILFAGMFFT
ncbi:MAG: hypothetical protein PHS95_03450 [Candidatus Pacebacteria bacterium]|nr:hypothetical protein [Candidatus Paceibacterota bacterium]